MAAGDWLLGCIPPQATDTGMFNRAYYLSGSYGLWRPVLIVSTGAIGAFLYYFTVKALNADIDAKYRKTKSVQCLCGIFTVAVALAIHLWSASMVRVTVEEIYRGEKYGVMSAATADYLNNGRPTEYDERTWLDMLLVKHALIAAEKMKSEGDTVSGMTDSESPSSYVRWDEHDNT